jgi:hypothetical protein
LRGVVLPSGYITRATSIFAISIIIAYVTMSKKLIWLGLLSILPKCEFLLHILFPCTTFTSHSTQCIQIHWSPCWTPVWSHVKPFDSLVTNLRDRLLFPQNLTLELTIKANVQCTISVAYVMFVCLFFFSFLFFSSNLSLLYLQKELLL